MADKTLKNNMPDDNPYRGPDPVEAVPNREREKTYQPATPPAAVTAAQQEMPEKTAQEKVGTEMSEAVDEVKKRL